MFKNKKERGQSIVLIAIAIVGLIGLTALAIDGGNAFSDRRHAQNAADTAALSAALAKVRGNDWYNIGINVASTNGYANPNQDVQIHTCDMAPTSFECPSPYDTEDSEQYIHVVITSSVDTFFAPVIGIDQVTNRVEAIARAKPPMEMFDGNAVVSVCYDGASSISGSSSNLIVDGGLYINSDDQNPCAFSAGGGSDTIVPSVTVVGCSSMGGSIVDENGNTLSTTAGEQKTYDYSYLDKICDGATAGYTTAGGTLTPNSSPVLIPNGPGSFPPAGVDHLGPGIYCLEDDFGVHNANLTGTDVTFVMLTGGVSLNGDTVTLSAPSTGASANLLFYQPAPNCSNSNNMSFNGSVELALTGSIIAPCVEVQVNGDADPTNITGQILACTFKLNGGAGTTITYSDPLAIDDPPQVELTN